MTIQEIEELEKNLIIKMIKRLVTINFSEHKNEVLSLFDPNDEDNIILVSVYNHNENPIFACYRLVLIANSIDFSSKINGEFLTTCWHPTKEYALEELMLRAKDFYKINKNAKKDHSYNDFACRYKTKN